MVTRNTKRDLDGKGRRLRGWAAAAFAAIATLAITTSAFAGAGVGVVRPTVTTRPLSVVSLAPIAPGSPGQNAVKRSPGVFSRCAVLTERKATRGTQVPLSCFNLPPKTKNNTVTRDQTASARHYHPLAATGATIDLTPGTGCGTQGALYTVGCVMGWQGTSLADWSSTDLYEDYYLAPNATTATLGAGIGYTSGTAPAESTTMSAQGTYAFFVYDMTAQVIVAIVYVNAGTSFNIGVYQDPYHTQLSYQYNINTSSAAYIYLPNVSTNDTYVVYIEYTSINTFCVYLTPNGTPAPYSPSPFPTGAANSLICNPNDSPGIAAPSGQLSLTWTLSESYPAGTYSVVVYDKTQGQTMGQVQVSLTGFQQYGFILNGSPAPNPSPATPATPAAVKFAWDNSNEQSTGGITATVPNQVGGTYTMTASDPDGQVVFTQTGISIPGTCTLTSNSSSSCTASGLFKFASASPALNSPGTYPNSIWTMQLYNPANKIVEASQAFELLGYSSETQVINGGTPGQQVVWIVDGSTSVAASLEFTNTANINYPNAADPIAGIEFATGAATSLNGSFAPPSNTTGNGVTVTLTGCTGTYNTTGCTLTNQVDSAGNEWTVTDYCSLANPAAPGLNSQCVLKITPQNSVTLAPGKSLTISGLTFYGTPSNGSWACFPASCTGYTSILPADGLAWSSTSTTSPAWTPVYFTTINSALDVTGQVTYIGSNTNPGNTNRNTVALATAAPTAWPDSHYYYTPFAQGSYEESSPFDPGTGRRDIMVVSIAGCNASGSPAPGCPGALTYNAGEVGITFPSYINASEITVDPSEPKNPANTYYALASTGNNACLYSLPPNSICLNPGAASYSGTGNNGDTGIEENDITQIWLDVPAATEAFTGQDVQLEVWNNNDNAWSQVSYAYTNGVQTPVVGGAVAGTAVDTLSLQAYSLNSSLMAAQFDPSTVSPGASTTSYSLTFTNTTTAADPNPDPVDAIVVEQVTSSGWTVNGTPTFSGTGSGGWSNLSGTGYNVSGSNEEYWFGVCTNQYTNHTTAGPPQSPPSPTNPSSLQTALGAGCTAAQEQDAIAAGGTMTFNFVLNETTTGTQSFYVYAHGANGGGWSAPKLVQVTSSSKTGSAQIFSTAAGATDASCSTSQTVAQNTSAQVSKSPDCFIYEVKNTSSSGQNIGTVNIALPAFDINGVSTNSGDWTLVGSPITQYVVLGTISGGTFKTTGIPAGCAISSANTYNPTPGSTPGQIEVSGCTGFASGDNIAVEFVVNTPSTESDSYLLPATIDSAPSGLAWTGSDEVTVSFSLGLAVSVDPDNPGPGNSHPVVTCNPAQCTFSGETVNFGEFGTGTTITGQDVVRATVVYEGSSISGTCPAGAGAAANTWQLQVSVNTNASNEFYTAVDESNSTSGLTYGTGVATYFNPQTTTTNLACGNYNANSDFDVLQDYEVINGSDVSGHSVTVTYTLIGN